MNDYYVYEHLRADNHDCFYVGKGRGKRAKQKTRNPHHDRIAQKYGMEVRIVADGLSEDEAYALERELIAHYVYDLGYGIDIEGLRGNQEHCLTNCSLGGDGSYGMVHSIEWCKQHSKDMGGEKNPMYGVNIWKTYSEEQVQERKAKISLATSGANNPMYGVSPKDRMDETKYLGWLKQAQMRLGAQTREKNPNSKRVAMYSLQDKLVKEFECIKDCAEFLKQNYLQYNSSLTNIANLIGRSANYGKPYKDHYFKFI